MAVEAQLLDMQFTLNDSGYSNAGDAMELPRHRWYFVKEAFSPRLVEEAIRSANCMEGDLIIDPFCGGGTVPLVASLGAYRGIGIEVNPFLAFLSRAKLLQCPGGLIDANRDTVTAAIVEGQPSPLETFSTFSQAGGAAKWLFNQGVLRAFSGGYGATQELKPPVGEVFQLALLGAAMDTCNASRDGKALRYRKDRDRLNYGARDFLGAFDLRVDRIREDMTKAPHHVNHGKIVLGDAREKLANIDEQFDLCVTSPPYMNSFDYTDVYRPELFLGGFVCSQQELRALRFKTVRSHVQAKWPDPTSDDFGPRYASTIALVRQNTDLLWNKRIPTMIQAYFEDMRSVLKQLHTMAKPHAKLWLVVSTSAYAGLEIPVDLIIADVGAQVGWKPAVVGVLRYLRSSSQHWRKWKGPDSAKPRLRESVVILRA